MDILKKITNRYISNFEKSLLFRVLTIILTVAGFVTLSLQIEKCARIAYLKIKTNDAKIIEIRYIETDRIARLLPTLYLEVVINVGEKDGIKKDDLFRTIQLYGREAKSKIEKGVLRIKNVQPTYSECQFLMYRTTASPPDVRDKAIKIIDKGNQDFLSIMNLRGRISTSRAFKALDFRKNEVCEFIHSISKNTLHPDDVCKYYSIFTPFQFDKNELNEVLLYKSSLETFLAKYPHSIWIEYVLWYLASLNYQLGRIDESEEQFQKYIAEYPYSFREDVAWIWLSNTAYRLKIEHDCSNLKYHLDFADFLTKNSPDHGQIQSALEYTFCYHLSGDSTYLKKAKRLFELYEAAWAKIDDKMYSD